MELKTSNATETLSFGYKLGLAAIPGLVVVLDGPLGVGKTVIAKGIARGLDIEDAVTSPSFTIVAEYPGRIPMRHIDLYRTGSDEELVLLGIDELVSGDAVSVIEWGEKAASFLEPDYLHVAITFEDETSRLIRVSGPEDLLGFIS